MPPTRTQRAAPLAPEARRAAIVAATVPLLRERGVHVTTRELADAAGVAEGTLFRVFPDKRALVRAAVERALDPGPLLRDLEALHGLTDLRATVVAVVALLADRAREVSRLLAVAHDACIDGPRDAAALSAAHPPHHDLSDRPDVPAHPGPGGRHGHPHGSGEHPAQVVARGLAVLLEEHRDQLRLEPAVAASLLVGLVLTSSRPALVGDAGSITPEQVTDFFLDGARRRPITSTSPEENAC
ncbi:TetR/AcrR family transcriptional regulator [Actinotalea subterranea]|uniref:TetR/AcrR family transcriptional regulator n=1 Tax=Actinotalea subterranea TaxID=2607497 RepID=UPI001FE64766|nr:TetR/AcrR family transcriptional regulator [Actinotalea subterranea]